jgi:4-amino-4-deoxy-L-arabinose transferase-like glycosyltransferase
MALGAGLRCFRLDQNSLWVDELASLGVAQVAMVEMPVAALRDHALNPPLYFWLSHLSLRVLGEGEAALRLPSVLAGILLIPVMWLLVRELTGNVRAADVSALLLAAHPLHLWYSQEARPYALLLLVGSVALWSLAAAMRSGRWWWAGFALASALTILTHLLGVVMLGVGFIWVAFRWREPGLLFRYAGAVLAAIGLTAPFLIMLVRAAVAVEGTGAPPRPLTGLEVPYSLFTFVAGYSFGPSVRELQDLSWQTALLRHPLQVALASTALAAIGWLMVQVRSAGARELAALFILPIVAGVAGSLLTTKAYNVRYVLPALLGFIPLTALALARLGSATRGLGTVALVSLFVWADAQWLISPEYRKEDSRAAAACLERSLPAGGTVAVAPAYMAGVLRHYAARQETSLRVVGIAGPEALVGTPEADALLLTRLHHVADPASLLRAFTPAGDATTPWSEVPGYRIYLADTVEPVPGGGCQVPIGHR